MKIIRKIGTLFLVMMLVILPVSANGAKVFAAGEKTITIFHTNDMHGSVEKLSYVKTMKATTPNSILVDAGDATQGSSLATYTQGKSVIELMNLAGYDGMTTGNHEFDYGSDITVANAKAADFPIVSANVKAKDGSLLLGNINGNNGSSFIVEREGIKVGFFGLTTVETAYKTNPAKLNGISFTSEIEAAKEEVAKLKNQDVDVIVALCHVGIDETTAVKSYDIAKAVDGIDVIIDGHSHSQDETVVNDTYICQTGSKLATVGEVKITVNGDNDITNIDSKLIENYQDNYVADAGYSEVYSNKVAALEPILNQRVTNSTTRIFTFDNAGTRVSRVEETPGGNLVADAMLVAGKDIVSNLGYKYPVVALQNGGGVRADLPQGEVTVGDIFDVLPFGNLIAVKAITPDVLYQTLEHGYQSMVLTEDGYLDVKAANGGFAQIAGMKVEIDLANVEGKRVEAIYLDGSDKALERNDDTTQIAIVSNDFEIAGGDGYTMLTNLPHIAEGGALDVVLQDYIKDLSKDGKFTYASSDNRINVKQINDVQNTGYLDVTPELKLDANKEYNVMVDGNEMIRVVTDSEGMFTLKQITNGMHTISVAGQDYYLSSYTNIGIAKMVIVSAPVEDKLDEDKKPPVDLKPSVPTGDSSQMMLMATMLLVSGSYLELRRKNG